MGIAGISPFVMPTMMAAEEKYEGPVLLTINAVGGWDVSNFCDPKGTEMNRRYGTGEIESAGNINYAPLDSTGDFFRRHSNEILVINGIDMMASGHTEGMRHAWSGALADNNTPSIAALFAAGHLRDLNVPAPFITFGGFSRTGDLLPITRLTNLNDLKVIGNYDTYRGFAQPYSDGFATSLLETARQKRFTRQQGKISMPRHRSEHAALYSAQTSADSLRQYNEFLPAPGETGSVTNSMAATCLASFKAGICASGSIYVSDFDTHSNHEGLHGDLLDRLLAAITYSLDFADQLGILDRLTIIVGSDFSRTPEYNDGGGKDHWPVGSMMLIGPGIKGNRVIGATDDNLIARNVNLDTLELDDDGDRLTPGHIHATLRKHLGIFDFGVSSGFDLRKPQIPLFT